jgi:hypothetical protein
MAVSFRVVRNLLELYVTGRKTDNPNSQIEVKTDVPRGPDDEAAREREKGDLSLARTVGRGTMREPGTGDPEPRLIAVT